jgi:O-antigen/teichoic acid export membrane protein
MLNLASPFVSAAEVLTGLVPQMTQSALLRDFRRLGSGALLSQLILVAGTPLVLRHYGPADFGLYTFAYGLVMLTGLAACGIDTLIVSTPRVVTAIRLLTSLFWIAPAGAVILAGGLCLCGVVVMVAVPHISGHMSLLWWVPAGFLILVVSLGLRAYCVRAGRFGTLAIAQSSRSLVFIAGSAVMPILCDGVSSHGALILFAWQITGDLCALLIQLSGCIRVARIALMRPHLRQCLLVLGRQWRMLGALSASEILMHTSKQMTIWTATFAYGAAYAGYYSLASAVVYAPATVVAFPLGDILYQRLSRLHVESKLLAPLLLRTTLLTGVIVALPLAAVLVTGPTLLPLLFGPKWVDAQPSIAILAIAAYLSSVNTPASSMILVARAHKFIVLRQLLQVAVIASCTLVAAFGLVSYVDWLALVTAGRSLIYVLEFSVSYALARTIDASTGAVSPQIQEAGVKART